MLGVIKKKFVIIYILNVTDILFTLLLLHTGVFMEANVFMRGVVGSSATSLAVKLGIPLILLYIVNLRIAAANEKQLKLGNVLINGCLILYSIINLSHVFWIVLYSAYRI